MGKARTFFLTDIHGCNETFQILLDQLNPLPEDQFFFLGDYIDRGPDSKGVIDTILKLEEKVRKVVCLLGNHEEMLLLGLEGTLQAHASWLDHGGRETLESFNAESIFDIPEKYIQFLKSCKTYVEVDGAILVHAGLDFLNPTFGPFHDEQIMRWIRNWYSVIDYDWLGDRVIVHGHTPTPLEKIKTMAENLESNRYLNLDSGCVYDYPGLGYLSAYDWTNRELISIPRALI